LQKELIIKETIFKEHNLKDSIVKLDVNEYLNNPYNKNIKLDNITDGWEAIDKLNGKTPFCDYCRSTQEFFDWEPHHKNEKQLDSFVLQKTINKN
jgi:hypothetical protein